MKLLMTTDTVGGVWTYAVELARALRLEGVQILLATMGAPLSQLQRQEAARLPHVKLAESTFKLEWMQDPWDDVERSGTWLLELEQEFRPDVIHLNGYAHGALPFQAPVMVVAHSCVLSWWRAVKHEPAPMVQWGPYYRAVTKGLHDADIVIAPSRAILSAIQTHYGALRAGRVIYNARDPSLYHSTRKEPFILSAGRLWDEAKNISTLAKAAGRIPWQVFVAGDDRSPDGVRADATSNVRSLGILAPAALADSMARAGIYALPARYEPFGLSILEAALSSCPLVLGDIPSLREIWGEAAIYVPPDDSEALASALNTLIDSPALRTKFSQLAHERATLYAPDRMSQSYLAAYRRLSRQPDIGDEARSGDWASLIAQGTGG
jgi:glycogen synthase